MRLALALILLLASAAALPAEPPELPLEITFPPRGLAVYGARVRISGWTSPGARVKLAGSTVEVYPSGAFVGMADIKLGANTIRVEAASGTLRASVEITVRSLPPVPDIPGTPTRLAAGTAFPTSDLVLRAGDRIRFGVRGSPGGKAELRVGELRLPMREREGLYSTDLKITPGMVIPRSLPVLSLRGRDGETVSHKMASSVETLAASAPCTGVVQAFRTRLCREPGGNGFVETLPAGAVVQLGGRRGDWQEIDLCGGSYWAPRDDIVPASGVSTPATLGPLVVRRDRDALRVILPCNAPLPVRYLHPEPDVLKLEFCSVGTLDDATPPASGLLHSARWERKGGGAELTLHLLHPPVWGYQLQYLPGRIELAIHRSPLLAPTTLRLSGLAVALDPGHGGSERGTVSPTGKWEKDANFALAERVRDYLTERGARVIMTRDGDVQVDLDERVRRAAEAGADLFVSLHFNSLPATTDPMVARGGSTWYQQPSARELAGAIQRRLVAIGLADRGVRRSAFRVILSPDVPSVLVEHLFMSHPEDEMLLLHEPFVDRLARADADGIADFALRHARVEAGP